LEVDVFDCRADGGDAGLAYVGLAPFRMQEGVTVETFARERAGGPVPTA
jgi:hypothetical protein